jgi:putative membrane protein
MVSKLLSEADARDIEAAVARVESRCAAELVIAVVPRSHDYWQVRVVLAVAWGLAAGLAFLLFAPLQEPMLAIPIQMLIGAAAFAISSYRPLLRMLLSDRTAQPAVQARAYRLFAERGLHNTRARTALLIFVSELERRVVMLGDQTIDAALGQDGWGDYVKLLVEHIRNGRARDGILELIAQLEPQLTFVAPPTAGDVNELPNALIRS